MRDFRQYEVWQKAHELTLENYRHTAVFPSHEMYGLTNQLRGSAVSIAANIVEGCGRQSDADFSRFLAIAAGSASETEYHLLLAADLGYLDSDRYLAMNQKVAEVRRMLAGLLKKLKQSDSG